MEPTVDYINGIIDKTGDCNPANNMTDCCIVNCPDGTIEHGYISWYQLNDALIAACMYITKSGLKSFTPNNVCNTSSSTALPSTTRAPTTKNPTVRDCVIQCNYPEDNNATVQGTWSVTEIGTHCIPNNRDQCCIIDCLDGTRRYGYVTDHWQNYTFDLKCIYVVNGHLISSTSHVCGNQTSQSTIDNP